MSPQAHDHDLRPQLLHDLLGRLRHLMVDRTADLGSLVRVDALSVLIAAQLDERLREDILRIAQKVKSAGNREPIGSRQQKPLLAQALLGFRVVRPAEGVGDLAEQIPVGVGARDARVFELEPLQCPARDEFEQLGVEQRDVHRSATDEHPSVCGLGEALDSPLHREDDDRGFIDEQLVDLVASRVPNRRDGLVDRLFDALSQLLSQHGPGVVDPDQDHAACGVGERHHRLLKRAASKPALALDKLALTGKCLTELGLG